MLSLTNISFSRISKEMVLAAAMCTFTGQVFCCGYEPFFRCGYEPFFRCGYEPFFRCGYEPPGRLENLRIKLTQTFIKDSVRSGLSLAITFVSRGSAHPLTPRCGKEKIKYAQNPPLVQHECKISQNRKSKI